MKQSEVDLSSGTHALVALGFNLFNGAKEKQRIVCDIFSSLDEHNWLLAEVTVSLEKSLLS